MTTFHSFGFHVAAKAILVILSLCSSPAGSWSYQVLVLLRCLEFRHLDTINAGQILPDLFLCSETSKMMLISLTGLVVSMALLRNWTDGSGIGVPFSATICPEGPSPSG